MENLSEAQRIVRESGTAIGMACDVADEAQVAAIVEYGRLDMANSAGIQVPPSDAADEPLDSFERFTAPSINAACGMHEARIRRYARARLWRDRELLFARRPGQLARTRLLSRHQARARKSIS